MMKKTILVLSLSVLLATSSFAPFIGSNNNIISFFYIALMLQQIPWRTLKS